MLKFALAAVIVFGDAITLTLLIAAAAVILFWMAGRMSA